MTTPPLVNLLLHIIRLNFMFVNSFLKFFATYRKKSITFLCYDPLSHFRSIEHFLRSPKIYLLLKNSRVLHTVQTKDDITDLCQKESSEQFIKTARSCLFILITQRQTRSPQCLPWEEQKSLRGQAQL